jgi:hypothetical protein
MARSAHCKYKSSHQESDSPQYIASDHYDFVSSERFAGHADGITSILEIKGLAVPDDQILIPQSERPFPKRKSKIWIEVRAYCRSVLVFRAKASPGPRVLPGGLGKSSSLLWYEGEVMVDKTRVGLAQGKQEVGAGASKSRR